MNHVTFRVETRPIAQPRHQVARGRAYIPAKHKIHAYKEAMALAGKRAMIGKPPFGGAVHAHIVFTFKRPKRLAEVAIPPHTKKPDVDNLVKAVLDSLNGICFQDDSQVTALETQKWYALPGGSPSVRVELQEWETPDST